MIRARLERFKDCMHFAINRRSKHMLTYVNTSMFLIVYCGMPAQAGYFWEYQEFTGNNRHL